MSCPQRRFSRLLVANRGEIATRLINAAREHDPPLTVFAVASPDDEAHTLALPAPQVLKLPAAASHMDIGLLVSIVKQNKIDAVHPGYGFLSESPQFAQRMWEEAGATVVGPGWHILAQTGDKLAARRLAQQCHVPVLPAMVELTNDIQPARAFVESCGFPVIIKAVDGGGGRGIRLVRNESDLEDSFKRAVQESPSKHVFVEKAAVDGFRHIEVQIVGDGTGNVAHLWERECSIQRRYQKFIELAPSPSRRLAGVDRFMTTIIDSAVRMAHSVKYLSLGTFEFLAHPSSGNFYFLEVNPRLQVEHTITEQIAGIDIVELQLRIAQGTSLAAIDHDVIQQQVSKQLTAVPSLRLCSVQFRVTAENPSQSFSLSIGKITGFAFPHGNGIRVDTNLVCGHQALVMPDFDSLLAKIIVTGSSWGEVTRKSRRALEDTRVEGVKTNLDVLRAIVASRDFAEGQCDTQWVESNIDNILEEGRVIAEQLSERPIAKASTPSTGPTLSGMSSSTVLLRKGDAWNVSLLSMSNANQVSEHTERHLLKLNRVLRNEFPSLLSAEVEYSEPGSVDPQHYRLTASATSGITSGGIGDASSRQGDPAEPSQVVAPFPGTLVEMLADIGDHIMPGQVVCVIKQMKMELEVRAKEHQKGRIKWITDVEDGAQVQEGALIAELDRDTETPVPAKL